MSGVPTPAHFIEFVISLYYPELVDPRRVIRPSRDGFRTDDDHVFRDMVHMRVPTT